jgi:hypothetical protein
MIVNALVQILNAEVQPFTLLNKDKNQSCIKTYPEEVPIKEGTFGQQPSNFPVLL